MSFLNPLLLAGAFFAAVPLIIHLFGRRNAQEEFFPAMEFLFEIVQRSAFWEKVRRFILLAIRMLMVVVFTFLLARPFAPIVATEGAAAESRETYIFVLDTSLSMSYLKGGESLLALSKAYIENAVSDLGTNIRLELIEATVPPRLVFQGEKKSSREFFAKLEDLEPSLRQTNISEALRFIADRGEQSALVEVLVFSDFSKSAFGEVFSLTPNYSLRFVDPAERAEPLKALPNVALTGFHLEEGYDGQFRNFVEVEVQNFGEESLDEVMVEVSLDGGATLRGTLSLEAREKKKKKFTFSELTKGQYKGEVRLLDGTGEDGYSQDDQLDFSLEVYPLLKVLALNGEPRNTPIRDELFFFEKALGRLVKDVEPMELQVIGVEELDDRLLSAFSPDVVWIANPPPHLCEGDRAKLLLEGSWGLIFSLGQQVEPTHFNACWESALGLKLRDLHDVRANASLGDGVGLTSLNRNHAIFFGADQELLEALRLSQTHRYFHLELTPNRGSSVIAKYESGAAALVELGFSERRAPGFLLSTSIDLAMSDLAIRASFVPWLQQILYYAGGRPVGMRDIVSMAGEPLELALPGGFTGAWIEDSKGQRREPTDFSPSAGRVFFPEIQSPGIWKLGLKKGEELVSELSPLVMILPSTRESDLSPVSADSLLLLGNQGDAPTRKLMWSGVGGEDDHATNKWMKILLLSLLVLVGMEVILAARG
ncbi:MAG: BatA domain-containing protein [Myxococcota bacterium]|nr:BatA domain-containing protein [Myxococcota bacterium]